MILCSFPSAFFVGMAQVQIQRILQSRADWGANSLPTHLNTLNLPLMIIVITHTNDEPERCTIPVDTINCNYAIVIEFILVAMPRKTS